MLWSKSLNIISYQYAVTARKLENISDYDANYIFPDFSIRQVKSNLFVLNALFLQPSKATIQNHFHHAYTLLSNAEKHPTK